MIAYYSAFDISEHSFLRGYLKYHIWYFKLPGCGQIKFYWLCFRKSKWSGFHRKQADCIAQVDEFADNWWTFTCVHILTLAFATISWVSMVTRHACLAVWTSGEVAAMFAHAAVHTRAVAITLASCRRNKDKLWSVLLPPGNTAWLKKIQICECDLFQFTSKSHYHTYKIQHPFQISQ